MIDKYIELKMFFDYQLPLILLGLGVCIYGSIIIIAKIMDWYEKRQKKMMDKYFGEEEDD